MLGASTSDFSTELGSNQMHKALVGRVGLLMTCIVAAGGDAHADGPKGAPPVVGAAPKGAVANKLHVVTEPAALNTTKTQLETMAVKLAAPKRAEIDRHKQALAAAAQRIEKPLLAGANKVGLDQKQFAADIQAMNDEKDPAKRHALRTKLAVVWSPKLAEAAAASKIDFHVEADTILAAMRYPKASAQLGTVKGPSVSLDHHHTDYAGHPSGTPDPPPPPPPPPMPWMVALVPAFPIFRNTGDAHAAADKSLRAHSGQFIAAETLSNAQLGGIVRVDPGTRAVVATAAFAGTASVENVVALAYGFSRSDAALRVTDASGAVMCEDHFTFEEKTCYGTRMDGSASP